MEDYPRTLLELEKHFSTEEACRAYLAALRWPDGFRCSACDSANDRASFICAGCGKETRVTGGTIFQDTRMPWCFGSVPKEWGQCDDPAMDVGVGQL